MTIRLPVLFTAGVVLVTACTASPDTDRRLPAAAPSSSATPSVQPCPAPGSAGVDGHTTEFPELHLRCLGSGSSVAMNRLGGRRPVLVNLWASWCRPCQREMPRLQRAAELADTRVLFLGVDTLDDADSARSFLSAMSITYPQVVDSKGAVRASVHAAGLPATFVVSPNGTVAYRRLGELSGADLAAALSAAGVTASAAQRGRLY